MKKTIGLLLFSLLFGVVYSQPKQPRAVVACEKMNILYCGVENPVSIAIPEVADVDIIVEAVNATIKTTGPGQYIVVPTIGTIGTTVTLKVFSNVKNNKKPMGEYNFRVKGIPLPKVSIDGLKENTINKNLLLLPSTKLRAYLNDIDFPGLQATITSYTFKFKQNEKIESVAVNGSQFSEEVKKIIKELPIGAEIFFEDIKCFIAGNVVALEPLVIKID